MSSHEKLYKKKLEFAKLLFGEDVKVFGEKHLWYVDVPNGDGTFSMYKFPEWNGWCWVIPNSLERPGNLDNKVVVNSEEE